MRFLHQDSTFSECGQCGPSQVPALRSFSDQCSQKGLSSRTSAMASCATTKETSTSLTALNQSSCSVSAASLQNCSTNTSVVREHSLPPCTTRSECVRKNFEDTSPLRRHSSQAMFAKIVMSRMVNYMTSSFRWNWMLLSFSLTFEAAIPSVSSFTFRCKLFITDFCTFMH